VDIVACASEVPEKDEAGVVYLGAGFARQHDAAVFRPRLKRHQLNERTAEILEVVAHIDGIGIEKAVDTRGIFGVGWVAEWTITRISSVDTWTPLRGSPSLLVVLLFEEVPVMGRITAPGAELRIAIGMFCSEA